MKFDHNDYIRFHRGMMEKPEAERFLEWLETSAGEAAFQKWVEQEWHSNPSTKAFSSHSSGRKQFLYTNDFFKNSAAILFIVLTTVSIFYLNKNSVPPIEYQTINQPTQIVKTAPKGKKNIITLSDGSRVHLNSESSISYLSNYYEERTIDLTGEAYFEVVSDSVRPFIVNTKDISTVALGTKFNINAYQEKKEILVSLVSGKVVVESNVSKSEQIYIHPGEGVGYGLESQTLQKKNIDIEKITSWKSGIIQFEEMPLEEVIQTLERWYGVNIIWDKGIKLPEQKCTGKFKPNEYLSNILQSLSHSIDFQYTINNKEVKLIF